MMNDIDYQKKRIQDNQKFLLWLINFNLFNFYPLRKWLGISIGHKKIDEISHLSIAYNTKYFKKGKKWFKQQTRVYQQPDLGYKLNLLLDKIPQLSLLPALLQPVYGLGALAFFFLTTTTYQPTTKDTTLKKLDATTNYGSNDFVSVHSNINENRYNRALLHFDISELPTGAIVSEAILGLYNYFNDKNYDKAQTGYVDRLTRTDWVELEATWNIYKTGSDWTTAGGDYTTTDEATKTIPISTPSWVNWNITNIVKTSIDDVSKQVHLIVRRYDNGTWSNGACQFRSKEYTDNTSLRPKLTVTYTVPIGGAFLLNFV